MFGQHAVRQFRHPIFYTNSNPQNARLANPQLRGKDRNMNERRYILAAPGLFTGDGESQEEGLGIDNASKAVV